MIVRHAIAQDVDTIHAIIGHYASQGKMLPRSKTALLGALSHFMVAEDSGVVIGCGALQRYGSGQAELYGLAVLPDNAARGGGRSLVSALIDKARDENIGEVFALTLAPRFFQKMGFHNVQHRELPLKVWTDCVACPKFGHCDEIAMVLKISAEGKPPRLLL